MILEERLGELEQEKQEFAEYEQLERQRRALEFSSYNHEFQKVRAVVCVFSTLPCRPWFTWLCGVITVY